MGEKRRDNIPYKEIGVTCIYGMANLLAGLNRRFHVPDAILIFRCASLISLIAILTIDAGSLVSEYSMILSQKEFP